MLRHDELFEIQAERLSRIIGAPLTPERIVEMRALYDSGVTLIHPVDPEWDTLSEQSCALFSEACGIEKAVLGFAEARRVC